jgi:hypothetical protein
MKYGIVVALACCGCVVGASAGEVGPDMREQLKALQEQVQALSQTVETQKKQLTAQGTQLSQMQVTKKADLAAGPANELVKQEPPPKRDDGRVPSWELPDLTVTVTAEREGKDHVREADLVGEYKQPRWTARRRFTETRTYVIPKGEFEFEYWNIIEVPRKGEHEIQQKFEAEIGLPYRLQLDLYGITNQEGNKGEVKFNETDVEVRWAFADWDKIPGNPTAYVEWKGIDGAPDHIETKMLFGGDATPRLHWSANLVWEHEMGGAQENSYELTGAFSYTVKDEKFSIGAEAKLAFVDDKTDRGLHKPELLLGPSIQLSPLKPMHINISALGGVTKNSPEFKSFVIVGWEF